MVAGNVTEKAGRGRNHISFKSNVHLIDLNEKSTQLRTYLL